MRCPRCQADDTKVIDSRESNEGAAIRRRRACAGCQYRFTTYERLETAPVVVIKSTGVKQPFDRSKIVIGVTAAGKGRPIAEEQIERLAEDVEDEARLQAGEITTDWIGRMVLERLRCLDDVVYLRFASVYKGFDAAADFQREVVLLKKMRSTSS